MTPRCVSCKWAAALQGQAQVLASAQPLRALWEYSTDPAGTALTMEFIALANHRKAIRAEIARVADQFRAAQIEALSSLTERYGINPGTCSPAALAVLMRSISIVIVMERALGMSTGHAETLALVEQHLQRLEGDPQTAGTAPG